MSTSDALMGKKSRMPEMRPVAEEEIGAAQAAELIVLFDLEARWENLRAARQVTSGGSSIAQDLLGMQRAYDAFRVRLKAYQARFSPTHASELLLNTPARLGGWCRRVRDLHLRAGQSGQAHSPVHLLEKAYRWADRLAGKRGKDRVSRATPPGPAEAVFRDLEALAAWCDALPPVP
jgi:hypothetical protein